MGHVYGYFLGGFHLEVCGYSLMILIILSQLLINYKKMLAKMNVNKHNWHVLGF